MSKKRFKIAIGITYTNIYKENKLMAGYCLKQLPPDVFKFIISEQGKIKTERGVNQYSFERVIIKLLKEHPNFEDFKKNLEQNKL